jgi:ATP-dependent exoDNAse (exonuclease V) beta subunit
LDNLNLLYVAFTRAKERLLVYVPVGKNVGSSRISDALRMVFSCARTEEFAPSTLTMENADVWRCHSADYAQAPPPAMPQHSAATPQDSSIILWEEYFTRDAGMRVRTKVNEHSHSLNAL